LARTGTHQLLEEQAEEVEEAVLEPLEQGAPVVVVVQR
jgi:hypothetical protein